jgi:hypothetical protein
MERKINYFIIFIYLFAPTFSLLCVGRWTAAGLRHGVQRVLHSHPVGEFTRHFLLPLDPGGVLGSDDVLVFLSLSNRFHIGSVADPGCLS